MSFEQLNIVVDDVEAAVAFYRQLGFEAEETLPEWMPHHRVLASPDGAGGFDVDIDSVAFARWWGGVVVPCVVLGVQMPSREEVDARYAALLEAGSEGLHPPFDAFWGARFAVVRDPAGQAVALTSTIDPEARAAPPDPATF